ncbi:translationally-controlled tumor protein homolog [Babylonia areolata]|uniref:translationally-controlled tumor protein homolog n=1 Tax=Babylonia areolata TaxID=304850 RepID=UPI003FD0F986
MIIFKDFITGDELFTDSIPVADEGCYYKFNAKHIITKSGGIDGSLIGANASAEEVQEEVETGTQCGLDFVMGNRLIEGALSSKKDFQVYFKSYFTSLQEKMSECQKPGVEFDKKLGRAYFDFIMEQHKDLSCFFGESDYACENNACFVKWLDDTNVEVYVFKQGLKQEKC